MKNVPIRVILLSGLFALGTVYSTASLAESESVAWGSQSKSTQGGASRSDGPVAPDTDCHKEWGEPCNH